jgi:protein TonB
MPASLGRCYTASMKTSYFAALAGSLLACASVHAASYTPKFQRPHRDAELVILDSCGMPAYPKIALRNEEAGAVTLQYKIAADGVVLDTAISRSSGYASLDKAVKDHPITCKFRPATINGKPVQGIGYVQFLFTLE